MSYLSVDDRRQREACVNGGGCDGASTGSDSLSSSAGQTGSGGRFGDEAQRQRTSPLSPNMELERARAKIRLLEKEV